MNPSNQAPLDYLNQIAPTEQKKAPFSLNIKTIIVFAAIAVVLVIILSVVASSIGNSRKDPWVSFAARLDTTGLVAEGATNNLKNSQLRSLNSDVKIYISNTKRDLQTPLTGMALDPAKLPATIVAKEAGEDMKLRLETGRLNAKFDSTYAREMSYQLATLLALLQQMYSATNDAENKAFLTTAYDNLAPTQEAIANFSASNE